MTYRPGFEPYKCRFCAKVYRGRGATKRHEQSKGGCTLNDRGTKYTERTEEEWVICEEADKPDTISNSIPDLEVGDSIIERDPLTPYQAKEADKLAARIDALSKLDAPLDETVEIMDNMVKVYVSRTEEKAEEPITLEFKFKKQGVVSFKVVGVYTKDELARHFKNAMLQTRNWLDGESEILDIIEIVKDADGKIETLRINRDDGPAVFYARDYDISWMEVEIHASDDDDGDDDGDDDDGDEDDEANEEEEKPLGVGDYVRIGDKDGEDGLSADAYKV